MKNITTKKKHDKDFNRLIELLAQEFKPLQIYQFAKLQHREKRNSVFAKHQVLNQWTYYLFIVTDGNGTSIRAIQDFVNANFSVFMGYQEKYGNLERLLYISACFSSLPLQHYTGTPDNEALLEMMCKSIALDNCKSDELPADKSIYRFLELVESFLKLTEKLCVEQFAVLQKEVDKMKELRLQNCYLLATDQIL
ncbi:MAG: hypothetical protein EOO91_21415 [Pedobacter sp.]|nr:MAG: hypothetical protein EOO91_21415 [Pedobacter sp.]